MVGVKVLKPDAALRSLPKEAVLTSLRRALCDTDASKRALAAELLGLWGGRSASRYLCRALADRDEMVREKAALALGKVGRQTAIAKVLVLLTGNFIEILRTGLVRFPSLDEQAKTAASLGLAA